MIDRAFHVRLLALFTANSRKGFAKVSVDALRVSE